MVMIEITEDKFDGLYENVEKGLRYFGKAMKCLGEMKRDSRGRYGKKTVCRTTEGVVEVACVNTTTTMKKCVTVVSAERNVTTKTGRNNNN